MRPLLLLCCLYGLTGCTQWHYDLGMPLVEQSVPDEGASLGQALAQLGPPHRISADGTGLVLAWEHWRVRETSLGIRLGALGADLLSLDFGDARVAGEFLLLGFDAERRLVSRSFSRWDRRAGQGTALQPFVGVSLVDVDDLVTRMPQHRWGATSLQRLSQALNAAADPDSGAAGLEQRGTPTGTGQRSLELQ